MNDTEILLEIADYLNSFEEDLYHEKAKASDEFSPIVDAKISAISDVINYIESNLGIYVRR